MFNHPENVCMTYIVHFKFSMFLSYELAKASIASFCHAIYPDFLVTYTSDKIKELSNEIKKAGCRDDEKKLN